MTTAKPLFSGLLALFFVAIAVPAHAASEAVTYEEVPLFTVHNDFVVGPGKSELIVEPGTTEIVELMITNRLNGTRTFDLSVEDVSGSNNPDQAVVLLGSQTGPYTLKDYIDFPVTSVELENGERARIPISVSVPEDAEPGGLYGSVLVSVISEKGDISRGGNTAAQSAVVSRVGTLFFVTVPGEIMAEGALEEFRTLPDTQLFTKGPIPFEVLFNNSGSIHLNPYGQISITNIFGTEVAALPLEPWYAMPESLRYREIVWNREYLLGRYTATIEIERGYDGLRDTKSITFYVLPWKLVLALFVVVIAGLMLRRYLKKKKNS